MVRENTMRGVDIKTQTHPSIPVIMRYAVQPIAPIPSDAKISSLP